MLDFIINGQGHGDVADRLLAANMNHNVLRPWMDKYGRTCITVWNEKLGKEQTIVVNAPSTLMKEQWIMLDEAVLRAARPMLRVWGDLVGAGLTYNVPNGMEVTVIQHQTMTDAGEATLSMDGMRETNRDRSEFGLEGLPLPIVHSDFSFSARQIAVSRRQRLPLDTNMIEQSTRKCVEQIEKLTLGTVLSYSYGGYSVYGMTNYPYRLTKTLTLPTSAGWRPEILVDEVLDIIQSMQDIFFNGPYAVWASPAWTKYLDGDYSATYSGETLRTRLMKIKDIVAWNKADYLSGFTLVVAQLTPDVIQAVTGMKLTTLQWDVAGGMEKKFKVMGIMVPRIRRNSNGNTGLTHAVAA